MCWLHSTGLKTNTSGRWSLWDSVLARRWRCLPVAASQPEARKHSRLGRARPAHPGGGPDYHYSFLAELFPSQAFPERRPRPVRARRRTQQVAATAAEPKKLVLLPGADHFFAGQLEAMQNALAGWLKEQLP